MNKENDLFLNMIANPDFTIDDFMAVGLTADNTGIATEESYKSNSNVQNAFKTDAGTFDESKYHNEYLRAQMNYAMMSTQNYNEAMEKQGQYHRDNIFVPAYQRRQEPDIEFTKIFNPLQQQRSIISLGRTEDPKLSVEEIAQTQKVYDPKTDSWHDSPNESFFTDFFETRVLAQWEEDGTHTDPLTNQEIEHKKGDLKLNENGAYYYENLAGRSVYGKTVLNKMNVITTDGSFLNKYDFFDSDDLEQKSIGGQLMKELALVGSMFIPYVGPYIATLSIATQSAGFLSTLGKMFLGSESPTLSSIEGWVKSVDRQTAKTQYAQENTWCWENFISLIGDVAAQLREQRIIFKNAPALFKGNIGKTNEAQEKALEKWTKEFQEKAIKDLDKDIELKTIELASRGKQVEFNKIQAFAEKQAVSASAAQAKLDSYMKGYNKIGEILSKTYMTAITVEDMYGEAKLAGASDLEATLLTLGYAAGEAWILNTGIGEHILPELRDEGFRVKKLIEVLTNKSLKKANEGMAKSEKIGFLKDLFNKGKKIAIEDYTLGKRLLPSVFAHGIGEGVEELSEELLADFSRACFNTVQWLQGDSKTRLNIDNILDRYSMSFFGGIVGGAINAPFVHRDIKDYKDLTPQQAIQELTYMIRNGKENNLIKTLKKSDIGDRNLSQTRTVTDSQGNTIYAAAENYEDSQDYAIKQAVLKQIQFIKDFLNAEGANISDESFLNEQTLKDLRYSALQKSATAGRYLQIFNSLSSELYQLIKNQDTLNNQTDMQERAERNREENGNQTSEDIVRQTKREELQQKIEETRKQLKDLVSGKRAPEFIADSLFEMIPAINNIFTKPSFIQYAEYVEKKKFSDIQDNIKAKLQTDYINWINTEGKDDIHLKSQIYQQTSRILSDVILEHSNYYDTDTEWIKSLNTLYDLLKTKNQDEWLEEASNLTFNTTQLMHTFGESFGLTNELAQLHTRINNVINNPNITDEQKNQAFEEYDTSIKELLLDNIDVITNQLIEKQYINSEIKSTLLSILENLSNYTTLVLEDDLTFFNSEVSEKYINKQQLLRNLIQQVKDLSYTPIEQVINKVSLSLTNKELDFNSLYDKINGLLQSKKDNIAEFVIDSDLNASLQEALSILELYKAIINGAKTDNVSFGISELGKDASDLWGYNKTLNEINKQQKTENWNNLIELSNQKADIILSDINLLYNKLKFIKTLYDLNVGQKLNQNNKVALNKDYIFYNKMKKFIITIPEEFKGKSELVAVINSLSTLEENYKDKNFNLTDEQKEKIEIERIKMEDAIYDFFQANSDMSTEQLSKLISTKSLNLFHFPTELLSEELDDLDDNSFVWWFAARSAVKATNFYNMYKQIIDDKIAPIPTQELATYLNYATVVNGNIFTKFFNAYRLSVKEGWKELSVQRRNEILTNGKAGHNYLSEDKYIDYILTFLLTPTYSNITLTEGIPGSGKTKAVLKTTIKLLQQFNKELLSNVYVIHGADSEENKDIDKNKSGKQLKEGLELSSATVFNREELMKLISQSWKNYETDEHGQVNLTSDDYYFDENKEIRSTLELSEISNIPSLIIIDEISKFNNLDLDLLNRFAIKYGITILTAGDFDQSGVSGTYKIDLGTDKVQGLLGTFRQDYIRSPKLGVSIRTANSQKTSNLLYLQALLKTENDKIQLHYYQDETGIYGDKVYLNSESNHIIDINKLEEDIKLMIETSPDEKIGYIYYSQNTELYKLLTEKYADKINLFYGGSAQGLEGTYYIIENNPDVRPIDYLKDLYTGVSRSMRGSIVINHAMNNYSINNIEDNFTVQEPITESAIKSFSEKRKNLYNKIIKSGNEVKYQKRKQQNITVNPSAKKEGLPQGIKLNNNEIPATDTDVVRRSKYKNKIDTSSEDEPIEPKDLLEGLIFHSFNTFETGVANENGSVKQLGSKEIYDKRRDGINGLIYIYNLLKDSNSPEFNLFKQTIIKNNKFSYNNCLNLLGLIRSVLLSESDKNKALNTINTYLPIKCKYITFAFKSVYMESKSSKYGRFAQYPEEQPQFIYANDEHSKDIQKKKLVAIIGDGDSDVLEIPLLTLTNPLTLIQLKVNNEYVYPEAYKIFKDNNKDVYKTCRRIIDTLGNVPEYKSLVNLAKLFVVTSNCIFYMDLPKYKFWMPAQMEQQGPQYVSSKGEYDVLGGRNYDADWIPIQEFKQDPSVVVSDILTAQTPFVPGCSKEVVQAGHPFVLISYDKNINNLEEYFVNQNVDPEHYPKKVKLVYVLPPHATVLEYIDNIYNLTNKSGFKVNPIGQITTTYKILSELFQNKEFIDYYTDKFGERTINFVKERLEELKKAKSFKELVNLLKANSDWTSIGGLSKYSLTQQLDGFLKSLVYPATMVDIVSKKIEENKEDRQFLSEILKHIQIQEVYYRALKRPIEQQSRSGIFYKIIQTDYNFDGKPYLIHGKVDSPSFYGNLNDWVQDIVENKVHMNTSNVPQSKDNTRYINYESNVFSDENNDPQWFIDVKERLVQLGYNEESEFISKEQSLYEIAKIINSNQEHDSIAIVLDDKLYISDHNDIFKNILISIQNRSEKTLQGTYNVTFIDNLGNRYNLEFNTNNNSALVTKLIEPKSSELSNESLDKYLEILDNEEIESFEELTEYLRNHENKDTLIDYLVDKKNQYEESMQSSIDELISYVNDLKSKSAKLNISEQRFEKIKEEISEIPNRLVKTLINSVDSIQDLIGKMNSRTNDQINTILGLESKLPLEIVEYLRAIKNKEENYNSCPMSITIKF